MFYIDLDVLYPKMLLFFNQNDVKAPKNLKN